MSKVDVLCDIDRDIMLEFSRLCVSRLNNYLPLKLFLFPFQHFLDANVIKEIKKDRLIIEKAAALFEAGGNRDDMDINDIFKKTIKVDDEFVNKLSNPLFSLVIRYDDFAAYDRLVKIYKKARPLYHWAFTGTRTVCSTGPCFSFSGPQKSSQCRRSLHEQSPH